ncbi:hypothetical protein K4K57_007536 [Colletotrichum sp. SAR 10_99]|nr:hypothetical protein K4K55_007484 [Colletotrichum sp. SAR 10_96]KAJ5010222.1 hypothetical protein K4K57_007536 [Colletotrichum sp. SAR 10_99]
MVRMCQIIFEDVKHLEVEAGDESDALDKQTSADMDSVKMDPAANAAAGLQAPGPENEARLSTSSSTPVDLNQPSQESYDSGESKPNINTSAEAEGDGEAGGDGEESSESLDLRPYSLPSVRELFRVLVNFLDPNDRQHTDTMRVMALRIIHVALESPKLVKPPPSQTSSGRSTPVPVKDRQKLGLEGGARKPDARQAMVESIGVLARMPTFMVELFVNYDCDADRADLCEDMIGLLARNALPDSATWSTTSVPPLCLDALLRYIQFLAERLDEPPVVEEYLDPAELRERRRKKKIIIKGTSKFNENPKGGLAYLEAQGIIQNVKDPVSVAQFLKGTSRVSKKVLGEYLSKKGSETVLEAYMNLFDFSEKRVDEALRGLLETFRLPGESALIERIVTCFAAKYCSMATPTEVANADAVFVLTYAIIMLNTDQHNPNLKGQKRMTVDDFARNLRGVNDGQDFAPSYLQSIYDNIRTNEIILPDEHDNKHAFDYAWRELIVKSESVRPLVLCDTNIYDADMFAATWRPIVSTLSYVFMSATDDAVFARIVTGFDECARVAAKYNNADALNQIVYSLSHMTTLATEIPFNTSLNTEVQAGESSVMVSELAVKLGRDFRAQLATLVLFRVVTGNEHLIRSGWKSITRIWLNLFVNSLVPSFFLEGSLDIKPIPLQTPSQVIDRGSKAVETGFFSAFTSYISSYAADDPPEPSEEELESTLCTVDCVNQCRMGEVFANISNLPPDELEPLVNALLDALPEDHSSTVIVVKSDVPSSPMNGQKTAQAGIIYDPAMAYILEFSTVLALRDQDTIQLVGKRVIDALQAVLRDAGRYHYILVSRAAFYLLKLLHVSYTHDYINVPVLLHTISSFAKDVLAKTSVLLLQGLRICIDEPSPLRNEIMTSPDFWAIMRALALRHDSAPLVFDILEMGCGGAPPAIIADNYESAILLLGEFASVAGRAAVADAKQRKTREGTRENPSLVEVVSRGSKAISTIYSMTARIPFLMKQSHLENNEDLTCNDHKEWIAIFGEVLFPLIHKLLKPEVFSSDPVGMSEMRVQAASLLCKVFLQYLVLLSEWDEMLDLWLKIIDIMDRLMNSGQGDSLEEAVRENLKNVVLFLASSGYLVAPSQDPLKETLWTNSL